MHIQGITQEVPLSLALGTIWSLLLIEAHKQTDLTSKASSLLPGVPVVLNNKITGLSTTWHCSLTAAFPSREIPTCRFSSASAKQQVGFTHLVKEIMSRSSGPTYQINAQGPRAILHRSLQNVKVLIKQSAKIVCDAIMSQAPEKWWRSTNGRESWLGSGLRGAGATESH